MRAPHTDLGDVEFDDLPLIVRHQKVHEEESIHDTADHNLETKEIANYNATKR